MEAGSRGWCSQTRSGSLVDKASQGHGASVGRRAQREDRMVKETTRKGKQDTVAGRRKMENPLFQKSKMERSSRDTG